MSTLTIEREPFETSYKEALPLLNEHWHELCVDTKRMKLDPDIDTYLALEKAGRLVIFVARLEGKIVGYYVGLLSWNLHYKNVRVHTEDIFWVHPSKRDGIVGMRLFNFVKNANKNLGVHFWKTTAKINTQASKFLPRMGFKRFEENFYQWVEG